MPEQDAVQAPAGQQEGNAQQDALDAQELAAAAQALAGDDDEEQEHGSKTTFTAEEVEQIIRKRLARQRQKLLKEITGQVQQQLLVDKAKQDGNLQQVVSELERELSELRPLRERYVQLEELAEARYQLMLKELPEPIRLLAPDDDAPVLEKERWLMTKALPAAQKLRGRNGTQAAPGNNPKDPAPDRQSKDDVVQEILRSYQANPMFRPLI
jgi:flagellar motility protein MotE (MotC chaperone)